MKTIFTICLSCLSIVIAYAQSAGKSVFAFLNTPNSARSVSLGSNFISTIDNDISTAWNNPASLNELSNKQFFASYNNYILDINSGYASYARHFKKYGTFAASILYLDYGKFPGYDFAGISTGEFKVQDQCINFSYGNKLNDKFRLGANLKYIYSVYESYVSNGISTDLSGIYEDTSKNLLMSVYARNIGFQAIPFNGTSRTPLPFELAFSISKKLEHLPLRYHLIFHDLQRPDMRYTITETGLKDENGNKLEKKMTMGDNILRHLGLGGELNLSKHFVLRFGYDHMRRKEMTQEQKRGMAGFSWGLGFRIKKLHISYGSSSFFAGYSINQFSLNMNLGEFYKSK